MRPIIHVDPDELVERIRQNVPLELQERKQWTLWKIHKDRKVPLSASRGGFASCSDPDTWSDFKTAARVFLRNSHVAKGFNLATGFGVAGLDLDGVVAADGTISPTMELFLNHLGSYCEYSPSGTGIRSFFLVEQEHENRKSGNIELYTSKHFLSCTGDIYQGRDRLAVADIGVERILTAIRPRRPLLPRPALKDIPADDNELLQKMFASRPGAKIRSLWEGATLHKSPSESDYSLMSYLMYWCGDDAERATRLFLSSARAERAKGQRRDYLQRMAQKVASRS